MTNGYPWGCLPKLSTGSDYPSGKLNRIGYPSTPELSFTAHYTVYVASSILATTSSLLPPERYPIKNKLALSSEYSAFSGKKSVIPHAQFSVPPFASSSKITFGMMAPESSLVSSEFSLSIDQKTVLA